MPKDRWDKIPSNYSLPVDGARSREVRVDVKGRPKRPPKTRWCAAHAMSTLQILVSWDCHLISLCCAYLFRFSLHAVFRLTDSGSNLHTCNLCFSYRPLAPHLERISATMIPCQTPQQSLHTLSLEPGCMRLCAVCAAV